MAAFNLTAELNLRGPSNLGQVVGNIKRQLSTISLNLNINPATSAGIRGITADVTALSAALRNAQTSAVALSGALNNIGASSGNISSVATALNSVNTSVTNINSTANNAGRAVRGATSEMAEFGRQSALAIRRFAAFSVATGSVYALARSISSAYGEFLKFNQEFVRLQQVTDGSAAGLQGLANEITRLSTSLGVSSQELLNVSVTLAQAGMSASETKTALEALAKSALAPSFDDLNSTVEGSIALMRQFGISAGGLEESLGSINAVAAKFAVESSDIITAIQRTGGVFAAASKGVSEGKNALNEFISVFTSVRATTRESAETIATGLRTIFTRIQRGQTIDALREYGVELTDLSGKFVGPYEAVKRLSEGLRSLDPRDLRFSKIVEELGGFRQIGKVLPLIQQFATAQQALGVAQRGSGSLAADAATAQESLANKMTKVREQFITLIRDIGQSQGFQKFVDLSLKLASALITVADAAKGVLPALTAIAAIRSVGAVGQFFSGFSGGLSRGRGPRGFATGGLVPGSGNGDTVPAMLTPGEFVIRKDAVRAIGSTNLHNMNKYASGGEVQKFAMGGMPKGRGLLGRRGARSTFKELTPEEIAKLSTKELIAYGKKLARDIFSTGGAGVVTGMEFIPVPKSRITPELESSLKTHMGQKGFWREKISPFGKTDATKINNAKNLESRESALKKQEAKMADEVAARSQQWTSIRPGSSIDKHLLTSLKEPILSDYITSKNGGALAKTFHDTRLRQAVNKALDNYDDFDYSPDTIDKLVSGMAAKRFAKGGSVQKLAAGGYGLKRKDTPIEDTIRKNMISPNGEYSFGIAALRSGISDVNPAPQPITLSKKGADGKSVKIKGKVYSGTLAGKKTGLDDDIEQSLIGDINNSVFMAASKLNQLVGGKSVNKTRVDRVVKTNSFQSLVGTMFESALASVGSPYINKTESTKSIDFPLGLGSAAGLFNLPSNIPTDATRTLFGSGKSINKFKDSLGRFLDAVDNDAFTKAVKNRVSDRINKTNPGIQTNILDNLRSTPETTAQIASRINSELKSSGVMVGNTGMGLTVSETVLKTAISRGTLGGLPSSVQGILKKIYGRPIKRAATGGNISGQDKVPALLTPGEFVINKNAAQKIGSAQLHRLNNADKISGFNRGGPVGFVQSFAGGGFVDSLANMFGKLTTAMSGLMTKIALWQRGIPSSGPSSGGWVGRGIPTLSSSNIGVTDTAGRRLRRTASDPMTLMFAATMAGEGIGNAIGGTRGAAISGGVSGFASAAGIAATIGSMSRESSKLGKTFGFLGAATISVVAAVDGYNQALRKATVDANNKKIESESASLEKSFETLAKQAIITEEDLSNIGRGIFNIINAEKDNRNNVTEDAKGGIIGNMTRRFSVGIGFVKELFGFDPSKDYANATVNQTSLSTQLLENSKASSLYISRAIEEGMNKGQSFDEVVKKLTAGGLGIDDINRAFAILQKGREITNTEAKIEAIKNDQLGAYDSEGPGSKESRIKALETRRSELINESAELYKKQTETQAALAASTKVAIANLDLFGQSMLKFGGAVSRAMSEFANTDRELDIIGAGFGKGKMAGPDRSGEQVFDNLRSYSNNEIATTVQSLGANLGFSDEFTRKAQASLISLSTVEKGLPEILLKFQGRQNEADFDTNLETAIKNLFESNKDQLGLTPEEIEKLVSDLKDKLTEMSGGRQPKSFQEIAQSSSLLNKLLENANVTRNTMGDAQKKYNDALATTINRLQEFTDVVSKATEMRLNAQERRFTAGNDLKAALGEEVTLAESNQAFENTIKSLTAVTNPAGIMMQGTTDATEIDRRVSEAQKEYQNAQRQRPKEDDKAAIEAFTQRLTKAKINFDKLSAAQEKLANDTTRASNILEKIKEQTQIQNQKQNQLFDLASNINNPEWAMQFMQNVQSYQRVLAGVGDRTDMAGAIEAFNRRQSVLPAPQAAREKELFGRELIEIMTKGSNLTAQQKDGLAKELGFGGPNDTQVNLIDAYNQAISEQTTSMNLIADRMQGSSNLFYIKVVEAATDFAKKISESTQDVPQPAPPPAPVAGAPGVSTGGLIYASGGKLIKFQPQGTDTVPAMLTPGEFVVNARATSKNLGLLQAINDGNSKGQISGGSAYMEKGGKLSENDITEILRKNRERIAENDKVKAMDDYEKARSEAIGENTDSLDWTYDYLSKHNIDTDSTIGQFLLDKAHASYDTTLTRLANDPGERAGVSSRDLEIVSSIRSNKDRQEARQRAVEQAELKKKDKLAREQAANDIGKQLAGKDRPDEMTGYLFRSADGRFDQMGDIADTTTDSKGNVSVTIKRVGGDKDGSLTKSIPLSSLDDASQFVVQSYMRQKEEDADAAFKASGTLSLDDVDKMIRDRTTTQALEQDLDRLSRRVKIDTSYSIPVQNMMPGVRMPSVAQTMGPVDPALSPTSRLGAWARAKNMALESLGDELGLWDGNEELRTFGVQRLLYEELIKQGIIGADQRQAESVDDVRLREIVSSVVNKERSIIQSRISDAKTVQKARDKQNQTGRLLGYAGEGLYNATPTRVIGEGLYGTGETLVGGAVGVLGAFAGGVGSLGVLGSSIADSLRGIEDEKGSATTQALVAATQSLFEGSGAGFSTVGSGLDRIGGSMTFDMEEMRQNSKDSALAVQEQQRRSQLSGKSLGKFKINDKLTLRAPSLREIYDSTNFVRDNLISEIATAGVGGALGFADDAAKVAAKTKTAAAPITSADEIARIQKTLADPLEQARARMKAYIKSGKTGQEVVVIPQGGQLLRKDAEALGLLQQTDEMPIFQPEVVKNSGKARLQALNPDKTAQAVTELRAATSTPDGSSLWSPFPQAPKPYRIQKGDRLPRASSMLRPQDRYRWSELKNIPWVREQRQIRANNRALEEWIANRPTNGLKKRDIQIGLAKKAFSEVDNELQGAKIPESFNSPMDTGPSIESLGKPRRSLSELVAENQARLAESKPVVSSVPEAPPVPPAVENAARIAEEGSKPQLRVKPQQTPERQALLAQRKSELAAARQERAARKAEGSISRPMEQEDTFNLGADDYNPDEEVVIIAGGPEEVSSGFFRSEDSSLFDYQAQQAAREARLEAASSDIKSMKKQLGLSEPRPKDFREGFFGRMLRSQSKREKLIRATEDKQRLYDAKTQLLEEYEEAIYQGQSTSRSKQVLEYISKMSPEMMEADLEGARLVRSLSGGKSSETDVLTDLLRFSGETNFQIITDPKKTKAILAEAAKRHGRRSSGLYQHTEEGAKAIGLTDSSAGAVLEKGFKDKGVLMHEAFLHKYQHMTGTIRSDHDTLRKMAGNYFDDFTKKGGEFDLILSKLGKKDIDIKDKPHEFLAYLVEAMYNPKTKALMNSKDMERARSIMGNIFQYQGHAYSSGGVVYASGGKLINFEPKGTDTVPAMLSPGEFVVNAKATSKNLGLLHAINGGAKGYSSGGVVYLADGGVADKTSDSYKLQQLTIKKARLEEQLAKLEDSRSKIMPIWDNFYGKLNELLGGYDVSTGGGDLETIIKRLNGKKLEITPDMLDMPLKEIIPKLTDNQKDQIAKLADRDSFDNALSDAGVDLPYVMNEKIDITDEYTGKLLGSRNQTLSDLFSYINIKDRVIKYLNLLQSEGVSEAINNSIMWDKDDLMKGLAGIDSPEDFISFYENLQKNNNLKTLPTLYQQELPEIYENAKQLEKFILDRSKTDTSKIDITAFFADVEKRLRDQLRNISSVTGSTPPVVRPGTTGAVSSGSGTVTPTAKPAFGNSLLSVGFGSLVSMLPESTQQVASTATEMINDVAEVNAEAQKVMDSAKNAPEADYYDELTYKEFLNKLIADKKGIVPPEKSKFTTPAYYSKHTATEMIAGTNRIYQPGDIVKKGRSTIFDSRVQREGNPNGKKQVTFAGELNNQLIELDKQAFELSNKAKNGDITKDPLKTEVNGFLSAVNQILAKKFGSISGASFNDNPAGGGFNFNGETLTYTLDDLIGEKLPSSLNPNGWKDEGIEAAREAANVNPDPLAGPIVTKGQLTGYKSAKSQYDSAVAYYIRKRGEVNYQANLDDKKEAYNKMMADRRKQYADNKEARQRAYLDPNIGRRRAATMSTGGVVYAQTGMLIPYQPRGTDTVPAMLTPGEFVVNRQATQQNMGLLKAINSGQNVTPRLFNKGGFVNTQYFDVGSNGPVGSSGSSSGGISDIKIDASSLQSPFGMFEKAAETVSSAVSQFAQGSDALKGLSQAFASLGTGTGMLSNAAAAIGGASTSLGAGIAAFATISDKLTQALGGLKDTSLSIKTEPLTVSGNVTVTIEGGTGGANTAELEEKIINKIAEKISAATNGGIKIV